MESLATLQVNAVLSVRFWIAMFRIWEEDRAGVEKAFESKTKERQMKKSLVWTILGLTMAATTAAHGQGGIVIGNYQAPYNPVMWPPSSPVSGGIHSDQGVNLTLWFGEGVLAADQLLQTWPLNWHLDAESHGYFGFYGPVSVVLANWDPGETWTFQVRASGNTQFGPVDLGSELWHENDTIAFIGGDPPGLPGLSTNSIGIAIPEPSTFAFGGLGLAALSVHRRRS
jgi:hypothetical protein